MSTVARARALPQPVVNHVLGFASNELAREFMMIQEPQTFVIMDSWVFEDGAAATFAWLCLLYTSPSPRDLSTSRMPSSA